MPIIGVIASSAKGAPAAPIIGTATNVGTGRAYNNGAATVTFTPGAGATATSFTATSSPGGFTATGASSPLTVTGLQSGVSYTFTVTATNAAGTSPASAASNSITATTVPQAPTIGTATDGGTGTTVSVTFTANATGGSAITGFTATSSPGSITGTGASSPITVSGLTAGTAYTFTVTATNANGTSAASAASNSVTPTLPTAYDSIATFTPNGVSTVTFSNISTAYKHLQLRFHGLTQSNTQTRTLGRPNGATSGFSAHVMAASPSAGPQFTESGQAGGTNGYYMTQNFSAVASIKQTYPYMLIADIGEYRNTSMNKVASMTYNLIYDPGGTGFSSTGYGSAMYINTSAITSFTVLIESGANYATGSSIALYGIKG